MLFIIYTYILCKILIKLVSRDTARNKVSAPRHISSTHIDKYYKSRNNNNKVSMSNKFWVSYTKDEKIQKERQKSLKCCLICLDI